MLAQADGSFMAFIDDSLQVLGNGIKTWSNPANQLTPFAWIYSDIRISYGKAIQHRCYLFVFFIHESTIPPAFFSVSLLSDDMDKMVVCKSDKRNESYFMLNEDDLKS